MHTLFEKAKHIKAVICDLDGVLTPGNLLYGEQGELFKAFHCHDGFGLRLLMKVGIEVAIITTADTPIVTQRMKALGIERVYTGQVSKIAAFEDLLKKLALAPEQVAMIGDDWPDLPLLERSGLAIAVANAVLAVKQTADWVTTQTGGNGAVREVCDLILDAQELTASLIDAYRTT